MQNFGWFEVCRKHWAKKNIHYMNNPNTLISRINKPATIRSTGGQIRAPIFLGVYFV